MNQDNVELAWGEQFKPHWELLRLNYSLPPSKEEFPRTLNPQGRPTWDGMFEGGKDPYVQLRKNVQNDEAWHEHILEYVKRVRRSNLAPFNTEAVNLNNDLLTMDLMSQRRHLVRFVNKHDFFSRFTINKIHRHYDFDPGQLTLDVVAELWPTTIDPTLPQWVQSIQGPRMLRAPEGHRMYKRELVQGPVIWIKFTHVKRIQLGYTIKVDKLPVVGGLTRMPTKAIMTKFMEQNIWLPIVRTYRFKGAKFRLF